MHAGRVLVCALLAGPEQMVAGPTPWGTELQLPDSWADAISTAQLPDDQPLHTPIEARRRQSCMRQ